MEQPKTRVILEHNGQLKRFFFVLPFEDGSIAFGSSFPGNPKELKIGSFTMPKKGEEARRVNFKDAENLAPEKTKFTYHPSRQRSSGIMHLKTSKGGYLMKKEVTRLEEMMDYKKLFYIIPSDPDTFPLFEKEKSRYDIVIPINVFKGKPFCVCVFLCRKDFDCEKLLFRNALNVVMGMCENIDYRLVIDAYNKDEFKEWSKYTTFIPMLI